MIALRGLGVSEAPKPNMLDLSQMPPPYPFKVSTRLRYEAKQLAGAFYEEACRYQQIAQATNDMAPPPFGEARRSPQFRSHWKSRKLYVAWCWPLFVVPARATLAKLLGMPHISIHMKDEILDILTEEWDSGLLNEHVAPQIIGLSR